MHPQTKELRKMYNAEGSELRTLQLKMLEILNVIDEICTKHQIPYWLSGGTLIGAAVHRGFIPWDDDIDIELMRSDYKRLLKVLRKELPDHLYLQTPKEKGYSLLFSKVRDRYSIVHSPEEDEAIYTEKGFYVDIAPQERSVLWVKKLLDELYGRSFRRIKRGKPFLSLQRFYEYSISLVLYPISILLVWIARGFFAITKPKTIVYTYGVNAKHCQLEETLLPTSRIEFEGKEFSAPHDVHAYLMAQYNCDYTQIPPVDKRPTHFTGVKYLKKE